MLSKTCSDTLQYTTFEIEKTARSSAANTLVS